MAYRVSLAFGAIGRISPQDLDYGTIGQSKPWPPVVETVKKHSPIALRIQLAHAGRKASTQPPWSCGGTISAEKGGWETIAPSALAYDDVSPAPRALSFDEIAKLIDDFVTAARRAQRIDFNLIELHMPPMAICCISFYRH